MSKHLAGVYLSNGLLLAFSIGWLLLIFIPLLIATDHAMGLWYENNVYILIAEAAICAFSITWSMSRIVIYTQRAVRKLRLQRQLRVQVSFFD